ncbi:MAG TPA: DNA/RNA non-specific endonuclease [Thermoanaerobaculia bacterium]|nr:DNA/RNA non-specific endonuclease [Thermoanaerobaculia bacterium]
MHLRMVRFLSALTVCLFSFSAFAISNGVVISQVYGGGGNSGATYKNDFVELFNRGTSAATLTGMSIQYASATGTGTFASNGVVPLNGTLAPGQYYLISLAGGTTGAALPAADATGTINMAAGAGKVIVANTTTGVACNGSAGQPCSPTQLASIVDLVGYGSANFAEGSPAPTASAIKAVLRLANGCTETDHNNTDFIADTPAPRNTTSPFNVCPVEQLSGVGTANPNPVFEGGSVTLTVTVFPTSSTGITVTADLSSIGGVASQPFGVTATTNVFSYQTTANATPGSKELPVVITDGASHTATATIDLTVQPLHHVVISQIYGGGGNNDATYNHDFVELYNPTTSDVDLTGWSLQYAPATSIVNPTLVQPIGGTIGPGQYYLIVLASQSSTGADLPDANIIGDINLSASTGKILLVSFGAALDASCPVADPSIVDFVGYGTANCHEGSANAAAPSNTTATFRKNGGALDTNDNANDFETGAPNPRRTAPIVDIAPRVMTTDPNGSNAPLDASITVKFSEDIDVTGAWYHIQCASGSHDDATVAGTGRIRVITPNVNFVPGETCTASIFAANVHDLDGIQDFLPADVTWSFTVTAAVPFPYPADVHLTMGNPSNAVADTAVPDNYLMVKPEYTLSYNRDLGRPNWVSWHLTTEWFGAETRVDTFRPDPQVPPTWYRVQATDFFTTGFDRGHMTPNADRDANKPFMQSTFLMSNMVAQAPNNNQGPWADLENYLRTLASAGNELYVIAGPAGAGGTGSGGFRITVANGKVTVPAWTWKVAVVLPKQLGDDVSRVTASTTTIAVIMPNDNSLDPDWRKHLTTIDDVQELTGYNLLSNVLPAVQDEVEAGVYEDHRPIATLTAPSTSTEGTAITANATVTDPDANESFSYRWTATKNGSPYATGSGASFAFTPDDNGTYAISLLVKDHAGARDTRSQTVSVTNVPPVITAISGPNSTLQPGAPATITVFYGDMGTADTQTAAFNWDDGSTSLTPCAAGVCTASHSFAGAGVYGVIIVVADDDGGIATANFDYIIVTDANAGSITGGGFVNGSSGKTSFGFNSAYQKGPKPEGNVEVQVQKNNFNFHGDSMDWLVVAGSRAQIGGTGTVNGSGNYGYVLTAVDSDADQFRIRIWDKTTGATVYDNVPGAPDDIDAANPQPIGGGSIVIHHQGT